MKCYKDAVFEEFDNCLWKGDTRMDVATGHPSIHWKGAKIPAEVWSRAVSFLLEAFKKYDTEAVIRFLYHQEKGLWECAPLTVESASSGGVTTEDYDPKKHKLIKSLLDQGYQFLSTIHTHGNMAAFMSGTDEKHETKFNGLHVTLGKLGEERMDVHSRVSFRGFIYDKADLSEWINLPWKIESAPSDLLEAVRFYFVTKKPEKNTFPEEWIEFIKPRPAPSYPALRSQYEISRGRQSGFSYCRDDAEIPPVQNAGDANKWEHLSPTELAIVDTYRDCGQPTIFEECIEFIESIGEGSARDVLQAASEVGADNVEQALFGLSAGQDDLPLT